MDSSLSIQAISTGLITYIIIAATLCLRAYGQAWMANRFGDNTPAMEGRLTMNPLPHMDVLGTVILPLFFIFFLQPQLERITFFLAWAKPVPVNPANFEQPKKHYLYCLLGETLISVIIMFVAAVIGGLLVRAGSEAYVIALGAIGINAVFIVLDLIPFPPLPGALILVQMGWMKEETYMQLARWGGLILIIAIQFPPVRMVLAMLQGLIATPPLLLLSLFVR
jgi:Zn-dependent protease